MECLNTKYTKLRISLAALYICNKQWAFSKINIYYSLIIIYLHHSTKTCIFWKRSLIASNFFHMVVMLIDTRCLLSCDFYLFMLNLVTWFGFTPTCPQLNVCAFSWQTITASNGFQTLHWDLIVTCLSKILPNTDRCCVHSCDICTEFVLLHFVY